MDFPRRPLERLFLKIRETWNAHDRRITAEFKWKTASPSAASGRLEPERAVAHRVARRCLRLSWMTDNADGSFRHFVALLFKVDPATKSAEPTDSNFSQSNSGRADPPSNDVFIFAILWCPSGPPQANISETMGKLPALKVRPPAKLCFM